MAPRSGVAQYGDLPLLVTDYEEEIGRAHV